MAMHGMSRGALWAGALSLSGLLGFALGARPDVTANGHPDESSASPVSNQVLPSHTRQASAPTVLRQQSPRGPFGLHQELESALPESHRQRAEARRDSLEARFRAEPVETGWSNAAEDELVQAAGSGEIAEAGILPDDIEIQCRSNSCRILSVFSPGNDADTWTSLYVLQMAKTLPRSEIVSLMRPDGSTEIMFYGYRR